MHASTTQVLTARLGRIYTQLLCNIVPRWVAKKAAVTRCLVAVVEMDPQNSSSWSCVWRFSVGSPILVHCGARVSHSVHVWQEGHQQHATFNQIYANKYDKFNILISQCTWSQPLYKLLSKFNYIKLQYRQTLV